MFLKVIVTGCALAALALAQGGSNGGGMGSAGKETGGMPPSGGGGMRMQKKTKGELMVDRLKLNKEQMSEIETILNAAAKESQEVVKNVLAARTMYANALVQGKDAAEIDKDAKQVADLQFQITGVEVRTFQKVVEILKPNQLAKAPEAFDIMGEIFLDVASAGGGGGRGMGRGQGGGGR